jgi:hypothetical protein
MIVGSWVHAQRHPALACPLKATIDMLAVPLLDVADFSAWYIPLRASLCCIFFWYKIPHQSQTRKAWTI